MKKFSLLFSAVMVGLVLGASAAWTQQVGAMVEGTVTEGGKPIANVQVILINPDTGRTYKAKTDRTGGFSILGVIFSNYEVKVLSEKGETIFSDTTAVGTGNSTGVNTLTIQIGKALAGPGVDRSVVNNTNSSSGGKAPKMTKEQIKAEQDKVASLNTLLSQAQTAMQSQKWAEAEAALKQVVAAQPETTRWELYKALGDSQRNNGNHEAAVQSYGKGIEVAQSIIDGKAPKDLHNPNPDPARARAGIGAMLTSQGNAYVKLGKLDEAIASFQKGAAIDPNPAVAYYNLCAVQFNAGKYEDAAAACDKSTAANANNAEAWFFKGAALSKAGKPGAADALNKYLQLDTAGLYAAQAKQMLATAK